MNGPKEIYEVLDDLDIRYEYYEHPPVATVEEAIIHWKYFTIQLQEGFQSRICQLLVGHESPNTFKLSLDDNFIMTGIDRL